MGVELHVHGAHPRAVRGLCGRPQPRARRLAAPQRCGDRHADHVVGRAAQIGDLMPRDMRSKRQSWVDAGRRPKVLLAAMCLWLALPFAAADARDLVVFGEPTLMNALQRVGAAWRERSGVRVNVFVAPTDLSFAQIHRGARCDIVFALVGPATDDAERRGIVRPRSRGPLLRNSLVLVARSGSGSTTAPHDRTELASFLNGKRLAIANPDRDPAGIGGLRWLRELGL